MYMYIVIGILILIIIILVFQLKKKTTLDTEQITTIQNEITTNQRALDKIKWECGSLNDSIVNKTNELNNLKEQISVAQNEWLTQQLNLTKDLEQEKNKRLEILEDEIESKKAIYANELLKFKESCEHDQKNLEAAFDDFMSEMTNKADEIKEQVEYQEQKFQSLLAPLQQYEKDQQAKLFYTVQTPEEYREDIDFLLTTVSQKVAHPDIISKLVWSEYIKPYIDETFKRIGAKDEPGIYKLTNINTGKAYIGKSTNVKKRIADHYKSAVGITTIADQKVHHEMLKSGIWNWTIEIITYCEKDKLNELEKYYIDFFKTQEYGYNRNSGGGG